MKNTKIFRNVFILICSATNQRYVKERETLNIDMPCGDEHSTRQLNPPIYQFSYSSQLQRHFTITNNIWQVLINFTSCHREENVTRCLLLASKAIALSFPFSKIVRNSLDILVRLFSFHLSSCLWKVLIFSFNFVSNLFHNGVCSHLFLSLYLQTTLAVWSMQPSDIMKTFFATAPFHIK